MFEISYDDIKPNVYNDFEIVDIDDLKESIRAVGLVTPVTVIGPDDAGKYTLISGERRYRAIGKLIAEGDTRYKSIPAYVIGDADMDADMQKLLIASANFESRDMSEVDKRQIFLRVYEILYRQVDEGTLEEKRVARQAAEYLKIGHRYAQYLNVIARNASNDLRNRYSRGKIGPKETAAIARGSADIQRSAVSMIDAGVKPKDVVDRVFGQDTAMQNTADSVDAPGWDDMGGMDDNFMPVPEYPDDDSDYQYNPSEYEPIHDSDDDGMDYGDIADDDSDDDITDDDIDAIDIDELIRAAHDLDSNDIAAEGADIDGLVQRMVAKNKYDAFLDDVITWAGEMAKKDDHTEKELFTWNTLKKYV